MSEVLFSQVSYPLSALVSDIHLGKIGLPDIQRPFVWHNNKVRDLFDSMYRGFPVGYLLFWENGAGGDKTIGSDAKQKAPSLLIVDGQQPLTSLYAVVRGVEVLRENYKRERISVGFKPATQEFAVSNAAVRRNPEYIPDISVLWSDGLDAYSFVKNFLANLANSRPISGVEEGQIAQGINRLIALGTYSFSALELKATVDEEQVAEVFVRINSKGDPLDQADFILTLMSVFNDEGRAELERFCRDSHQPATNGASPFNYLIKPKPDQLLRPIVALGFRRARLQFVYSILRGKDLETGQFSAERRDEQFALFHKAQGYALDIQHWHEFLKAVNIAGFRSEAVITSQNALLYTYALFLIGKRDFAVHHATLRMMIARWFFMASLTGRYTNSPETRMEQDLADLRGMGSEAGFVGLLNRTIDDALTDDFWNITLPNELATSSPRSPSLFAYYAALQLLDARVLFSKMKVSELLDPALKAKKSALERHHLFPKAYLATLGITDDRDTNQIANYALLEWADNIDISKTSPAVYYPLYTRHLPGGEREAMHHWHALPEEWHEMAYPDFLTARRRLLARVIRDGFATLSPDGAFG